MLPIAKTKTVEFSKLEIDSVQNCSLNNFNDYESKETTTDRHFEMKNQLRLDHLNDEEKVIN